MPRLVAVEAETIVDAAFLFLGGHFGNMDDIYIHGVGVSSRFRWQGSMVIKLFGGVVMLLGN